MVKIPSLFKVGIALAMLAGPFSPPLRAQDKPAAPAATPATPATPAAPGGGLGGGARGGGASRPAAPAAMPEAGRPADAGRAPVARERSETRGPTSDVGRAAPRAPDGDRGFARSRPDRERDVSRYSRDSSPSIRVRIGGGRGYYDAPRRHYRYGVRTYPRYVGTRCVVRKRLIRTMHGPRMVVRRVCFR
jgi:hypothetical protein